MLTVLTARTSVCSDLVVAGGEAFGGQVLQFPVHGSADRRGSAELVSNCWQVEPSAMMVL